MPDPVAVHSSFTLERDYPKPPATVFAALADPAKKRRWYAESDHHEFRISNPISGSAGRSGCAIASPATPPSPA